MPIDHDPDGAFLIMVDKDTPWLLVCGGFHPWGGMDKANWHLARYLVERGTPVHVITHQAEAELAAHPLTTVHIVPRPGGSYLLGAPLLAHEANATARRLRASWPRLVTLANGGNWSGAEVNWSHYVHQAWKPEVDQAPGGFRLRKVFEHRWHCLGERRAYRRAQLIITNSEATSDAVKRLLGPGARAQVIRVYLGAEGAARDPLRHRAPEVRRSLRLSAERKIALVVGGVGHDNRKGLDVLLDAWGRLCEDSCWDADLVIAGGGPALERWKARVAASPLAGRVRFLGFRKDMENVLAAADVLVSAPRYEPYGLNIQEALVKGITVVTSQSAGIAERFPEQLKPLLIGDVQDPAECAAVMRRWRATPEYWQSECARLGEKLAARQWRDMASEMVELIESMRQEAGPEALQAVAAGVLP